jgi:hypothetical protein
MSNISSLIKKVPKDSSVAAPQNLVPHLSHRKEIYLIWPREHSDKSYICGRPSCWWLDFVGKPDYLVVSLNKDQTITQLLESSENFTGAVKNMEKDKKIKIENRIGDAVLYRVIY